MTRSRMDALRPPRELSAHVAGGCRVGFDKFASQAANGWKLLRPYQWVKNLLVLLPVMVASEFNAAVLFRALGAFAAFSLAASAGYVVNDLLDRNADRRHHLKRRRPLASGSFPPYAAAVLAAVLYVFAAGLAYFAGPFLCGLLVGYCVLALLYSWQLKRWVGVDVAALATFYVLRIAAGSVATGIVLPAWLFASAFLFFCSLALLKRYAELRRLPRGSDFALPGRGYHRAHTTAIAWAGPLMGALAVVVMMAAAGPGHGAMFRNLVLLYLAGGVTFLWLLRKWKLARDGHLLEAPVAFALRDGFSYAAGGAVILLFCLSG